MTLIDDIRKIQDIVRDLRAQVEANQTAIARNDEQVNGPRGLSAAIDELTREVAGLRKAAYWVAGLIVAGAISFAFSVLLLIP